MVNIVLINKSGYKKAAKRWSVRWIELAKHKDEKSHLIKNKSIEKCELNRQNYHDKTNKQAKQRELLGCFGYGPFDLTRPAGSLCSHPRDTSGTKGSSEGQQNRTQRLPNARLSHLGDVT